MTFSRIASLALAAAALCLTLAGPVLAAQPPVGLGTADSFAVLSGSTVTNTGPSVVNGDLGVSPGTAVTGFPPGTVNGTIHAADAVAGQAQSDTTIAYNDAAGRTPAASVPADLGGLVLSPGVYNSASSMGLTSDVTLDGQGDPSAVFIFQAGSALTTASGSRVVLINGRRRLQRLLAGRQLRHARDELLVPRNDPRPHLDHPEHRRERVREDACAQRGGDDG